MMKKGIKLIAFDLDGVIVEGRGSWSEIHRGLGTEPDCGINENAFYAGEIDFAEWARRDVSLWIGAPAEKIENIFSKTIFMKGAPETLRELKGRGYRIAIISGGLRELARRAEKEFDIDFIRANELVYENGKVSGVYTPIDMTGKGDTLKALAEENGFGREECAAVGDFVNDIPMFKFAGFSIAFNPKVPELERFADVVIKEKDLRLILPYF